jgi:uracil-DNA glycosylase
MGTRQGKSILFQNCREFIAGEVEILRPEVIVTQGTWAREALVDAFPVLRQESMPSRPHYGYQVLQLTGHTAIKFDTAHPRAGRLFWPEKSVAYPWYVQEAHQFVLSRVQGLAPRV